MVETLTDQRVGRIGEWGGGGGGGEGLNGLWTGSLQWG